MTQVNDLLTLAAMTEPDSDQRAWLNRLLEEMGVTATELARRAGLNPSTLTRFLNEQTAQGHTLTFRTVRKIEQVAAGLRQHARAGGFGESEAVPFEVDGAPSRIADAIRALIGKRNAVDPWQMRSDDLTRYGISPGDILIVDLNESPRNGDVVCAQVFDQPREGARTVFRLYEQPFLLSGSVDPAARRPILVDNANVVLRGVVTGRVSPRFSDTPFFNDAAA